MPWGRRCETHCGAWRKVLSSCTWVNSVRAQQELMSAMALRIRGPKAQPWCLRHLLYSDSHPNRFAVWTFAAKFCWAPHESNLPSVELMMVLSCQYPSVVSSSLGIVLLQCHWILYNKTWFGKQTCFSKYMLYDVLLILSTVKQYARQYNRCFIFIKCISQLHCS